MNGFFSSLTALTIGALLTAVPRQSGEDAARTYAPNAANLGETGTQPMSLAALRAVEQNVLKVG